MNNINKPKIIEYIDFRLFLKDFFEFKKKSIKKFSYRKLAASLSLSSPSFISEVIKGKKKLSQRLILKLSDLMQLSDRDSEYLELLVKFNQARGMEEKNHYFRQLSKFRSSMAKIIHTNQYKFYSKWYYPAVWNYFGMNQNETNPSMIAREIFPQVTPARPSRSQLDVAQSPPAGASRHLGPGQLPPFA